jgi:dTDP-4-dehydrorhamnose 3,5-epimerase
MPLSFTRTTISGLTIITPHQFEDERGFFFKYFEKNAFANKGFQTDFNEFNVIMSYKKGTLKGLPYQHNPTQCRLVYLIAGSMFDVALDLRKNSETFGKYECFCLSKDNYKAIYMPGDFAHGCLALEDGTIICEQFTGEYVPEKAGRILWNDKDINIPWPIDKLNAPLIISEKERNAQTFAQYKLASGINQEI